MRIVWNPKDIYRNPRKSYDRFYQTVTRAVKKEEEIDSSNFYAGFRTFAEVYKKRANPDELVKLSGNLVAYLVNKGQEELASIAYSVLIKLNKNNPKAVEDLALKGLAIAKRTKDPIHIFSRARNLAELYEKTNPGCEAHVKYLRVANKALKDVCRNYYTTAESRFRKISRDLKPLENYEFLLCATKLDIAKYTYKQDLCNARNELILAKELLEKNKNSKNLISLEMLKQKAECCEAELSGAR